MHVSLSFRLKYWLRTDFSNSSSYKLFENCFIKLFAFFTISLHLSWLLLHHSTKQFKYFSCVFQKYTWKARSANKQNLTPPTYPLSTQLPIIRVVRISSTNSHKFALRCVKGQKRESRKNTQNCCTLWDGFKQPFNKVFKRIKTVVKMRKITTK